MINFALVGCGGMANWHAQQLKKIPEAKVVAVVDPIAAQTKTFCEKYFSDAKEYDAFDKLLEKPPKKLDAVVDCDVLVCGDDAEAKQTVMRLVGKMGLHAYDVGPAESARVVEGLTSILIRLNIRHKVKGSGIRLTALPR
jgi:predicted dinucleotide-binding enzyme